MCSLVTGIFLATTVRMRETISVLIHIKTLLIDVHSISSYKALVSAAIMCTWCIINSILRINFTSENDKILLYDLSSNHDIARRWGQ